MEILISIKQLLKLNSFSCFRDTSLQLNGKCPYFRVYFGFEGGGGGGIGDCICKIQSLIFNKAIKFSIK